MCLMLMQKENIVIEGKDTDATFHGVATLQMMFSSFSGKKFLDAHIEDYATVCDERVHRRFLWRMEL